MDAGGSFPARTGLHAPLLPFGEQILASHSVRLPNAALFSPAMHSADIYEVFWDLEVIGIRPLFSKDLLALMHYICPFNDHLLKPDPKEAEVKRPGPGIQMESAELGSSSARPWFEGERLQVPWPRTRLWTTSRLFRVWTFH